MADDIIEREIAPDASTIALLNSSDIDMQIATAHKYPRSITAFRKEVYELVTLSETIADECFYALPRKEDGRIKMIEGPSARFAEIIGSCWGNARVAARVIADKGEFIVSQGLFHDLQRNWQVAFEVERRVTSKSGNRYSADMIAVTGNAASSIALRNAILKGIPKALWSDLYESARRTAAGDVKTLPTRRTTLFEALRKLGITDEQVFAKLNIVGIDDVGLDEITTLKGMMTAIKEGDTTIEQAFALERADDAAPAEPRRKSSATAAAGSAAPPPQETKPAPPAPAPTAAAPSAASESQAGAQAAADAEFLGAMDREEQRMQSQPEADSGELASEGERNWLLKRCAAHKVDIAALLAQHYPFHHVQPDLRNLTKVQFDNLRVELV